MSGELAERGPFLLRLQWLFLGRSELHGRREREIITVPMQGRLATGTYLSGALPQYIPGRSKRLLIQVCFDAKKKGRESKSKTSFSDLLQRQRIVLLNYLWCYLGGIYRL